tara:strand:+ start:360 stop:821 length:462 start_codon:yes stop_codon:yes gene_type:complete
MDLSFFEVLLKSVISATIAMGALLAIKNLYLTCVLASAGWDALKSLESPGFNQKGIRLARVIKWLLFWPILLPAKIHGSGYASAKICEDVIAVVFPGEAGDASVGCAQNAGKALCQAMTERSDNYKFEVKDIRMDDEDFLVLVFERKEKSDDS